MTQPGSEAGGKGSLGPNCHHHSSYIGMGKVPMPQLVHIGKVLTAGMYPQGSIGRVTAAKAPPPNATEAAHLRVRYNGSMCWIWPVGGGLPALALDS